MPTAMTRKERHAHAKRQNDKKFFEDKAVAAARAEADAANVAAMASHHSVSADDRVYVDKASGEEKDYIKRARRAHRFLKEHYPELERLNKGKEGYTLTFAKATIGIDQNGTYVMGELTEEAIECAIKLAIAQQCPKWDGKSKVTTKNGKPLVLVTSGHFNNQETQEMIDRVEAKMCKEFGIVIQADSPSKKAAKAVG